MGNGGWYGTEEEWKRIEAPLRALDPAITQFAEKYGLIVTKNHKGNPERSISWGTWVDCLIQVYLVDQQKPTFNVWICASQDRDKRRYWKRETLAANATSLDLQDSLLELFERGKRTVDLWCTQPDTFEFATEVMG